MMMRAGSEQREPLTSGRLGPMKAVTSVSIPGLSPRAKGKVREIFDLGDTLLLVATDRISAFDVVLESVGGRTLIRSIELLASGGRLVSVGNSSEEPVSIDAALLVERDVSLSGLYLGNELLRSGAIEEFQKVVNLCGRGELKVIVDRVLPLAEAAAAHRILADRANFGKIILRP